MSENQVNTVIRMDMTTLQGFEGLQRAAKLLSSSTLVPESYRGPNGLANCVIAFNLASRLNADPLMVMQNLYIVHGRPGWSSKYLIACFNQCGRFSALRFEFKGQEGTDDWACRAWAVELQTKEKLLGPWVSMATAKREGWFQKNGSKWQTMPEQMLRYRAASWMINTTAPELAMGLPAADEVEDADAIPAEIIEPETSNNETVETPTEPAIEPEIVQNKPSRTDALKAQLRRTAA